MISSKEDYHSYLEADRVALNYPKFSYMQMLKFLFNMDSIYKFQRLLRRCEYLKNTKINHSLFYKIQYYFYRNKLLNLSIRLNFSIPENVFGPGLAIVHYGTIIVNPRAKIGQNCRIHACTNIGESGGEYGAPVIGDNVYIAPGVKIYGDIRVSNNIAFAANAAVGKDCLESDSLYGGVPANKIKDIDIKQIIKHIHNA